MSKSYLGKTKIVEIEGEKITIGTYSYGVQKDIAAIAEEGSTESALNSVDKFLVNAVREWTLTDEQDVILPITTETFNILTGKFMQELIRIATEFNGLDAEAIKNLEGQLDHQPRKPV